MKNATQKILLILLISTFTISLSAQVPDLVLQKNITPEYIAYLDSMETEYLQLVPGTDDTQTMKAYMGLALLQAARTHVNGDTLINDLEYLFDDIGYNIENILFKSIEDLLPLFFAQNPNDFVLNLTSFFESGTYPELRDSVRIWMETMDNDAYEIEVALDQFARKTDPHAQLFGDYWDAVADSTADFEFFVKLDSTKYQDTLFVFSRTFFNRLDHIDLLGESTASVLDSGFTRILDSLNVNSADIEPGVVIVRNGLDSLSGLLDSVQVLLWNQPFAPFEFDLAGVDSLQELIAEFDTLMAGKEYPIGPEMENKTLRPRGIIESLAHSDGPWGIYQDFYRNGENRDFTFSNTFPHGITNDMYAMIASDIVLNGNDTRIQFEAKVHLYQEILLLKEASPLTYLTPDEHFGLALTLTYDLLNDEDFFGNIQEALYFISEGHIDSLTYYYDWSSFDLQDQIDEIRYHVDQYIESEEITNYVILTLEKADGIGGLYTLDENSEFSISYLTVQHVMMITESIEMAMEAMSMIADAIDGLYSELSNILILDLDPTVLDFSDVESEMDIILVFEQSNPDFLSVTPYGVEKFHEMGAWLEDAFLNLGTFFDNMTALMNAMAPYETDFDMSASDMEFMMEMMSSASWDMYKDFAYPDSTMWMDDERVNMSAWFDNPPASFLTMWKNFVAGVDSTMGGMFPDRYKANETVEIPSLPKQFRLYPIYPNPFNPVAKIEFDLPKAADVKLTIIDMKGAVVQELLNHPMKAGKITTRWNAAQFPSGVYFCRLTIDGKVVTRKLTLMK